MIGSIDDNGRALLEVDLAPDLASPPATVQVWIDTGFTGDLVLPQRTITAFALPRSGSVDAILADGSEIQLNTFTCIVRWFGEQRQLEVIANDGDYPLLGVGMLLDLELRINYRTCELSLDST